MRIRLSSCVAAALIGLASAKTHAESWWLPGDERADETAAEAPVLASNSERPMESAASWFRDSVSAVRAWLNAGARSVEQWNLATNEFMRARGIDAEALMAEASPLAGAPVEDEDIVIGEEGTGGGETITTSIPLNVAANASVVTGDIGLSLSGNQGQDVSSRSISSATGVAGKGGDDDLSNTSMLTVSAVSSTGTGNATLNLTDSASANADVVASAIAVGLDGGRGADTITNSGSIEAQSATLATSLAGEFTLVDVEGGEVDAFLTSSATAIAMNGGGGNDTIINNNMILAEALSGASAFSYAQNIVGNGSTETPIFSSATSIGMSGGDGADSIANHGTIQSTAFASPSIQNVNFAVAQGLATIDAGVTGIGTATGLDGGAGNDFLLNTNQINVNASALTTSLAIESAPVGIDGLNQVASIDGSPVGIARGTGMSGGTRDDTIDNQGILTINADAVATGGEIDLAAIGSSRATAALRAEALAIGIDGGSGADTITNQGTIDATADSDVVVVTIAAGVDLVPVVPLTQLGADGTAVSSAQSVGIHGGAGSDTITNNGTINSTATATMTSVEVAATLGISTSSGGGGEGGGGGGGGVGIAALAGTSGGGGGSDDDLYAGDLVSTSTSRLADAAGILGGDGNDFIENTGAITANANATMVDVNASASLGLDIGARLAGPLAGDEGQGVDPTISSDGTSALAQSTVYGVATGINAGEGDDTILNSAMITAHADSDATGVSAKANIAIPTDPISAIIPTIQTASDASATVAAHAAGILGGNGSDFIQNDAAIMATADADAVTVIANLETQIAVPITWFLFDPVAEASSTTTARSMGIHGDVLGGFSGGDDVIVNNAMITSTATAHSVGVNANLTLGGAAIGNTESISESFATGIDGGAGDDMLMNHADLLVTAESGSVAVDVEVIGIGAAISSANTTAASTATGISGGETVDLGPILGPILGPFVDLTATNDDVIFNDGAITVSSTASSVAALVDVNLGLGASVGVAGTSADAGAFGIRSNDGSDVIFNEGVIDVDAIADSSTTQVAVVLNSGASVAVGDTDSEATAVGIDGDAGDDMIVTEASVDAFADADTQTTAVTVTGIPDPLMPGLSVSVGSLGTLAEATAKGLDGGDGDDWVEWQDTVNATANAGSGAVNVGVNMELVGASVGYAGTESEATSIGVAGGAGNDILTGNGNVTASSTAETSSVGVEVTMFVGASVGVTDTLVNAHSTGISGGEGNDTVMTDAVISSTAHAESGAVDVTFALAGAAVGNSDAIITADAVGIDGGGGNDVISGGAQITATSTADTSTVGVDVSPIGAAVGSAGTNVTANATGVRGGDGNDTVIDLGAINASATSTSGTVEVQVNGTGAAVGSSETSVASNAIGIDGEGGDDTIIIDDTITSTATATNGSTGVSVSLVGAGIQNAKMTVDASATGAAGGDGNDGILNNSTITANATATGESDGVSVNLVGAALGDASMDVSANATGMDGGAGDDIVDNQGTIDVDASSTADFASVSFSLIGAAEADIGDADTIATTNAVGMAGGDGADVVRNKGTVDVDATSSFVTGANSAVSILGHAGTSALVTATPEATGLDGGSGNDYIENLSIVDVDVSATAHLTSGSSFAFAGAAADDAEVNASPTATGAAGGAGDDTIRNEGTMTASSTATLDVDSDSNVAFGVASASAKTNATATTIGIDGGDGNDFVENTGTLGSSATATTTSDQSTYAFAGDPTSSAVLESRSDATGVATGDGDDWVRNDVGGLINVDAISNLTSTGGAKATFDFGTVESSATVGSTTVATGISTGAGADTVVNLGTVDVDVNGSTSSANNSNAGIIFGDSSATATSTSGSDIEGVNTGDGDDTIYNEGLISVTIDDRTGSATAFADSDTNGGDITLDGDATSRTTASASASVDGVIAGGGNNVIMNAGGIEVTAAPKAVADSDADGDGADGDGRGFATATVGTGSNPISATGISAADGDNEVVNTGSLTVTAAPVATATSNVDGDNAGSASGTATATAHARAAGIELGHGANVVVNEGSITVNATPSASASAVVGGGWAGPDSAAAHATAAATAFGIKAGDGGNEIWNTGTISVNANGSASAHADDGDRGDNEPEETETVSTPESATAIQTGAGDDTIVNAGDGTIVASENGVAGTGTAISTGGGNDFVELIEDSFVHGSVQLGAGDDVIAFADNSSFSGGVFGGAGSDTLRILDRRTLTFAPGTFQSVERLEVNQGRIEITGDYTLLPNGALQSELFNEGYGQLEIFGDATIGAGSEIIAIARPRAYMDGDTFDLLVADSVSGVFDFETLPDTRFLSSTLNYFPDTVQLEIGVVPFDDVARNKVQHAVGGYLDEITPSATGELADLIGNFQLLSDQPDIDTAFTSLSPDSYDSATRNVLDVGREMMRMHSRRMRALRRATPPAMEPAANPAGEFTMANGSDMVVREFLGLQDETAPTPYEPQPGPWVSGIGLWGEQDEEDGFTGFDHTTAGFAIGLDHVINDGFLAGVSFGYTTTDFDLDDDFGGGDIESFTGSLYASMYRDNAWLSGSVSVGLQEYDNRRNGTVGMINYVASSDHDGTLFGASLEGGLRYDVNDEWRLEPHAGLFFNYLDEDGFTESGAGVANLVVDDRSTDALISEIGLRMAAEIRRNGSTWSPFVGVSWVHDFDLDDRSITSGFAGAPGTSFTLDGLEIDDDRARIEAGFGLSRGSLRTEIQYFGEFASGYDSHGVMATLNFKY